MVGITSAWGRGVLDRPTPLGTLSIMKNTGEDVSLPLPSHAFHGKKRSNCRQQWDFPTVHWGTDSWDGKHPLSAGVEEKEQRQVLFPKSLPRALGVGVRRAGDSAETSASQRELHLQSGDLCKRANSVLKQWASELQGHQALCQENGKSLGLSRSELPISTTPLQGTRVIDPQVWGSGYGLCFCVLALHPGHRVQGLVSGRIHIFIPPLYTARLGLIQAARTFPLQLQFPRSVTAQCCDSNRA